MKERGHTRAGYEKWKRRKEGRETKGGESTCAHSRQTQESLKNDVRAMVKTFCLILYTQSTFSLSVILAHVRFHCYSGVKWQVCAYVLLALLIFFSKFKVNLGNRNLCLSLIGEITEAYRDDFYLYRLIAYP